MRSSKAAPCTTRWQWGTRRKCGLTFKFNNEVGRLDTELLTHAAVSTLTELKKDCAAAAEWWANTPKQLAAVIDEIIEKEKQGIRLRPIPMHLRTSDDIDSKDEEPSKPVKSQQRENEPAD